MHQPFGNNHSCIITYFIIDVIAESVYKSIEQTKIILINNRILNGMQLIVNLKSISKSYTVKLAITLLSNLFIHMMKGRILLFLIRVYEYYRVCNQSSSLSPLSFSLMGQLFRYIQYVLLT